MLSELINSFAVVTYTGGELARFVNDFRCQYTPGCPHRAHVTLLPPRPLSVDAETAAEECAQVLSRFEPFEVQLTGVDLFEETQVVKLTVGKGASELRTLHDILNTGAFAQDENYAYTPHITLSMKIGDRTGGCFSKAKERWASYAGSRTLWIDHVTLVQQRADETWTDLVEISIGEEQVQPVRSRRF